MFISSLMKIGQLDVNLYVHTHTHTNTHARTAWPSISKEHRFVSEGKQARDIETWGFYGSGK